jgi:hypothetical protein
MAHIRTDAKAYKDGVHIGPGPWLNVVREANGIHPGMFGAPLSLDEWWAGGTAEEYTDARVLHRGDDTVSIVSKTPLGDGVLRAAAATLGINVT